MNTTKLNTTITTFELVSPVTGQKFNYVAIHNNKDDVFIDHCIDDFSLGHSQEFDGCVIMAEKTFNSVIKPMMDELNCIYKDREEVRNPYSEWTLTDDDTYQWIKQSKNDKTVFKIIDTVYLDCKDEFIIYFGEVNVGKLFEEQQEAIFRVMEMYGYNSADVDDFLANEEYNIFAECWFESEIHFFDEIGMCKDRKTMEKTVDELRERL